MKAKITMNKPRRVYIYKNGNMENIREDMITFRRELEKDRTKSADEMYNKFVEDIQTSTEKRLVKHSTEDGMSRGSTGIFLRSIKKKRRYDKAEKSGTPEAGNSITNLKDLLNNNWSKAMMNIISRVSSTLQMRNTMTQN